MRTEKHLYTYDNYRDILKDELYRRRKLNPNYSQRAFARDIKIVPHRLSAVLAQKQGLSRGKALSIAQALNYSNEEQEFFCQLVVSVHARNKSERAKAKLELEKFKIPSLFSDIELDKFKIISDWYHLAITALAQTKKFQPQAKWIASMLGIPEQEVSIALQRLLRLGVIQFKQNRLQVLRKMLYVVSKEIPSSYIMHFHEQVILKSLGALKTQPLPMREFNSIIVPVSVAQVSDVKKELVTFLKGLSEKLASSSDKDYVYCLSTQFFNLTPHSTNVME